VTVHFRILSRGFHLSAPLLARGKRRADRIEDRLDDRLDAWEPGRTCLEIRLEQGLDQTCYGAARLIVGRRVLPACRNRAATPIALLDLIFDQLDAEVALLTASGRAAAAHNRLAELMDCV
jgi:hypothetical protein